MLDALGSPEVVASRVRDRDLDRPLYLVGNALWSMRLMGECLKSPSSYLASQRSTVWRLTLNVFATSVMVNLSLITLVTTSYRCSILLTTSGTGHPPSTSKVDASGSGRVKDQPLPCHASGVTRLQINRYPFVTDQRPIGFQWGLSWDDIVHTRSVDSEDLDFSSQRSRHEE